MNNGVYESKRWQQKYLPKQILPDDPVCEGMTSENGLASLDLTDGIGDSVSMSSALNRAFESMDCAASIFAERSIRAGTAIADDMVEIAIRVDKIYIDTFALKYTMTYLFCFML